MPADPSFTVKLNAILGSVEMAPFAAAVREAITRGISESAGKMNDVIADTRSMGARTPGGRRDLDNAVRAIEQIAQLLNPALNATRQRAMQGDIAIPGVTDSPKNVAESIGNEVARMMRRFVQALARADARTHSQQVDQFNKTRQRFKTEATARAVELERLAANPAAASDVQQRAGRKARQIRQRIEDVENMVFDPDNNQTGSIRGSLTKVRRFGNNATYSRDVRETTRSTEEIARVMSTVSERISNATRAQSILRTTGGSALDIDRITRHIAELKAFQTTLRTSTSYDPARLVIPDGPTIATAQQAVDDTQKRRTEDRSRSERLRYNNEVNRAATTINNARDQEIARLENLLRESRALDEANTARSAAGARNRVTVPPSASYTSQIEAELNRARGINGVDIAVDRGNAMKRTLSDLVRNGVRQEINAKQIESERTSGRRLTKDEENLVRRSYIQRVRDTQGGAAAFFGINNRIDTDIGGFATNINQRDLRDQRTQATRETAAFERQTRQAQAALRRQETQIAANTTSWRKFGDQVGLATKRFGAFLAGSTPIFALLSAISQGFQEALRLEKAQTRLSQILGTGRDAPRGIVQTALSGASNFGVAASQTLSGVDVLAQAGIQDPAQLQNLTRLLSRVPLAATFGSLQETSEGLIAVNEIFGKTGDSLLPRGLADTEKLFDRLSRVSADYAVEVRDIFEAVRRGGSTFRETGGDLSEFIKLVTLVRSRSRESAESIGVFFKSLSFRLQRSSSKTLLNALNIDTTNGPYSTLRQLSDTFSNGLIGANGKRTQLSEGDRVRIAESIAGVNQGGKFITLLQSMAEDRGRFERTVGGAGGSFTSETDKRIGDVATSLERVKESFSQVIFSIIDSSAVRGFFSALATGTTFVSKFASAIAGAVVPLVTLLTMAGRPALATAAYGLAGRIGIGNKEGVDRLAGQLAPIQINPATGQDTNAALRERLQRNIRPESVMADFYYETRRNQAAFEAGITGTLAEGANVPVELQRAHRARIAELARRRIAERSPFRRLTRGLGFLRPSGVQATAGIIASQAIGGLAESGLQNVQQRIDKEGLTASNASIRRNVKLIGDLSNTATFALTAGFINPLLGLGVAIGGTIKSIYDFQQQLEKDLAALDASGRTKRLYATDPTSEEFRRQLETLGSAERSTQSKVLAAAIEQDIRGGRALDAGKVLGRKNLEAGAFSQDRLLETYIPALRRIGSKIGIAPGMYNGSLGQLATGITSLSEGVSLSEGRAIYEQSIQNTPGKVLSQQALDELVAVQAQIIEFNNKSAGRKNREARNTLAKQLEGGDREVEMALRDYEISFKQFFADVAEVITKSNQKFTDISTSLSSDRLKLLGDNERVAGIGGAFGDKTSFISADRLQKVRTLTANLKNNYDSKTASLLSQNLAQGEIASNFTPLATTLPDSPAARRLAQTEKARASIIALATESGKSIESITKTLLSDGIAGVKKLVEADFKNNLDQKADLLRKYANVFDQVESSITSSYGAILSRTQEIDSLNRRIVETKYGRDVEAFRQRNAPRGAIAQLIAASREKVSFNTDNLISAATNVSELRRFIKPDTDLKLQIQAQRELTDANAKYTERVSRANAALEILASNLSKTNAAISEYRARVETNRNAFSSLSNLSTSDVRTAKRANVNENMRRLIKTLANASDKSGKDPSQILDTTPGLFDKDLSKLTKFQREQLYKTLKSLPGELNVGKATGGKRDIFIEQIIRGIEGSVGSRNSAEIFTKDFTASLIKEQKSGYEKIAELQKEGNLILNQQLNILQALSQSASVLLEADVSDLSSNIGRRSEVDKVLFDSIAALTNATAPLLEATNKMAETLSKSLGIEIRVDPVTVEIVHKGGEGIRSLLNLEMDKLRSDIERVFRENLSTNIELGSAEKKETATPMPDVPAGSTF